MTSPCVEIAKRPIARTDLHVSEYGLGCARIGGIFKTNPSEFVNLLAAAFDAGINFFDTSDIYSQGESERVIGRAFRGRRDRVVIASKAGYILPSQRRLIARVKPVVRPVIRLLGLSRRHVPAALAGSLAQDFSPTHLRRAVEGSLRRLGTDHIDLYQLHSPSTAAIEAGDWVEALERLKEQGKIRYYGISCDSLDAAMSALKYPGVSALQVALNMLEREALAALPQARAQGVGVIARECLANGLLVKDAATIDIRRYVRSDEEAAAKAEQLSRHRQEAAGRGCSLTQLALQFVNQLDGVAVSLLGVSSLEQLNALLSTGLPAPARGERRATAHPA
jgi:aryl-alcohol dehydrogenase-like predicted oxidoreductase